MTVKDNVSFGVNITLQNLDSLELLELNDNMQWTNRFNYQRVAGNVVRTLGGGIVTFRGGLVNGRPIVLEAQAQTGWLTDVEVNKLNEWADIVDPTTVFRLSFYGETHDVLFSHQEEVAVSFQQLQSRQNTAGGWFTGAIRLYTV